MKASELRIGNLVDVVNRNGNVHLPTGIEWRIIAIGLFDIQCLPNEIETHRATSDVIMTVPISDLCPIPLTEERLIRLGFESNPYQDRYENKAIHVQCNKTRGYTELWIERMPHIQHVHQLQNLYFTLTGEELTTKTPIQ